MGTFSLHPPPIFSFLRLSTEMYGNQQILKIVCSGGSVKLFRHSHEQNVSSSLNFLLEPADGNLPSPSGVCKGRQARGQEAGLSSTAQQASACWLFSAACKYMPYCFESQAAGSLGKAWHHGNQTLARASSGSFSPPLCGCPSFSQVCVPLEAGLAAVSFPGEHTCGLSLSSKKSTCASGLFAK